LKPDARFNNSGQGRILPVFGELGGCVLATQALASSYEQRQNTGQQLLFREKDFYVSS